VVSAPVHLRYLTGFNGSLGLLVLSSGQSQLLLDGRYEGPTRAAIARREVAGVTVRGFSGSLTAAMAQAIGELPPGDIGFEADRVTVATLQSWQAAVSSHTFKPTFQIVEQLRLVKDADEVAVIRRACSLLSGVAQHLRNWVAAGRTERQIAADIDAAMMRAGFDQPAFQTIAASGPNSAHPHARPTDRQLQQGDLVVLDFGGVLDGYCGDLTRMASVGQVQANARTLVDAVRAAQDSALAAVRAGAFASDIDKAARDILSTHGLADAFLHATGHGLGLELHEAPRLGRADADRAVRLEAGMVCTIEPGAYIEGLGGARMEDDVVVTPEGCEVLTTVPRDLLVV
jgi:Xaa-Pro aminopeptidase